MTRVKRNTKAKTVVREAVVRWRFFLLCGFFVVLASALVLRLAQVQALPSQEQGYEFLQNQGEARILRTEKIEAHRGVITDRNGEPLAISTPVLSICADPKELYTVQDQWPQLAQALGMAPKKLADEIEIYKNKSFMYLQRHLPPEAAAKVLALKVAGVFAREEYRRYYPAGEVAGHLVGMANIDEEGQSGIELAYDEWLKGIPGSKVVKKDRKGRVIEEVNLLKSAEPGKDLALSLDMRLQYLAYRALKNSVTKHSAVSGSIVVLDSRTSEVLAMANQPSYNPNNRAKINSAEQLRNRAMTDQFEPGSTVKPFTVLAALESGKFSPTTKINTTPGCMRVPGKPKPVCEYAGANYGEIDITRIIAKSSQVGITKVALQLDPHVVRDTFFRMGIGQSVGTGFPGESIGTLPPTRGDDASRASFAYGYGMSTTTLQLAQAYAVIANEGSKNSVSLLKLEEAELVARPSEQVLSKQRSQQLMRMLEAVISEDGTGKRAQLPSYSAAGKTGTAHKAAVGGYKEEKFSLFVGTAPAHDPRIVIAIMINEPRAGLDSGGQVAAPVFADVADSALKILQVAPDKMPKSQTLKYTNVDSVGKESVSAIKASRVDLPSTNGSSALEEARS